MSCMPKFGRLWAIDFCNQFFLRRAPRDDDRLLAPPAQDRAPLAEHISPARPGTDCEVESGRHFFLAIKLLYLTCLVCLLQYRRHL